MLIIKILLTIHHNISAGLYMSNHVSLIFAWINFMPPLSSVRRNCFYSTFESTFELTHQGGGPGRGDGKSMCVCILQVLKMMKKMCYRFITIAEV